MLSVTGGDGEAARCRSRSDVAVGGGQWAPGDAGGDGHFGIPACQVLVEGEDAAGEQREQSSRAWASRSSLAPAGRAPRPNSSSANVTLDRYKVSMAWSLSHDNTPASGWERIASETTLVSRLSAAMWLFAPAVGAGV